MSERPTSEVPADTRGTFTFGQRLGLVFIAQVAFLSALMVGSVLSLIISKAFRNWRKGKIHLPSPIHIYFISLLVADFVQALGSIADVRWVHIAGVQEGQFCTAQAILKQIGDTGVALSTLAIAIQTFGIIVLRWSASAKSGVALVTVATIWTFLALCVGVSYAVHLHGSEPLYGNTKYWCWIRNPPYLSLGIALEYGWMWFAALCSFLLYAGGAIVLYRNQQPGDHTVQRNKVQDEENRVIALQMILYPVIYTLVISPISIVRFIQFRDATPPIAATIIGGVVLSSSGALNVILFAWTRPAILPISDDDSSSQLDLTNGLEEGKVDVHGRRAQSPFQSAPFEYEGTTTAHRNAGEEYDNGF